MNAYRTSGTVAADRTITVRVPEASVGSEAEVIVLFPEGSAAPPKEHPLRRFLADLRQRPTDSEGWRRSEEEQAFLRELRAEWD